MSQCVWCLYRKHNEKSRIKITPKKVADTMSEQYLYDDFTVDLGASQGHECT
jgi:predicted DNA-binding helix-hairpin-helix protein